MAVVIQFRRGAADEWTAANPILAEGEVGVELNTKLFKIGDGATPWGSLPYAQRGLKGDTGATGATGPGGAASIIPGPKGDKGEKGDKGDIGFTGATGAPGADGYTPVKGIDYLDGVQGLPGERGEDGRTILNSVGVPASDFGVSGDYCLDTIAAKLYGPKNGTDWGAGILLIGLQGEGGAAGVNGVDGKTVRNGAGAPDAGFGSDGDFYIDTSNDNIYGPKTSGVWGSSTSLIGPQGPAGADSTVAGPQGIQGERGDPGPGNLNFEGNWVTDTLYHVNDILKGNALFYRCKTQHTSGASTEPGVGASWVDSWELFGGGGGAVPIGLMQGLVLSRKDDNEVYVSAGSIEIGGILFSALERLTGSGGSVNDLYSSVNLTPGLVDGDVDINRAKDYDFGVGVTKMVGKTVFRVPSLNSWGSNIVSIKTSMDGSTWTEQGTLSNSTPGWKEITFAFVECRFVRFTGAQQYYVNVSDMATYGPAEGGQKHYIYIDPPSVGSELAAGDIVIDAGEPAFDPAKGGYYHQVTTALRSIGYFMTDGDGFIPNIFYLPGSLPAAAVGGGDFLVMQVFS